MLKNLYRGFVEHAMGKPMSSYIERRMATLGLEVGSDYECGHDDSP